MAIKINNGTQQDREKFDMEFQAALMAHSENPTAETQAKLVLMYEKSPQYLPGCGVCCNGRALFIRGLAAMASGDVSGGLAQVRGGFAAVGLKLGRLKNLFG